MFLHFNFDNVEWRGRWGGGAATNTEPTTMEQSVFPTFFTPHVGGVGGGRGVVKNKAHEKNRGKNLVKGE